MKRKFIIYFVTILTAVSMLVVTNSTTYATDYEAMTFSVKDNYTQSHTKLRTAEKELNVIRNKLTPLIEKYKKPSLWLIRPIVSLWRFIFDKGEIKREYKTFKKAIDGFNKALVAYQRDAGPYAAIKEEKIDGQKHVADTYVSLAGWKEKLFAPSLDETMNTYFSFPNGKEYEYSHIHIPTITEKIAEENKITTNKFLLD